MASLRRSLLRKALAAEQHRSALAEFLELRASDLLALQHLALDGELTPSQLGRRLRLSSGGGTVLLQRLERAGCVSRDAHPTDRRSVLLQITPEIQRRLADALAPLVDGIDSCAGTLNPPDLVVVQRFLGEVSELSERHAEALRNTAGAERASRTQLTLPPLWA